MKLIDSIQKIHTQSRHHQMEIVSSQFLLLALAMMITLAMGTGVWYDKKQNRMSEQAVYTTAFTMSKSGVNGNIVNVFSNDDQTRALLLFQMESTKTIPTDANDYSVMLIGSDANKEVRHVEGNPSMALYNFGDGLFGLYLVNNAGFGEQIVRAVIRNNREIVDTGSVFVNNDTKNDVSFQESDQFQIYFNPGGLNAVKIDALNGSGAPDPRQLLSQMTASGMEQDLRTALENNLTTMDQQLQLIAEYTSRLQQAGVRVPSAPAILASDSITTEESEGRRYKVLHSDVNYPNGINFIWQTSNISQGYLDTLNHTGKSNAEFIADITSASSDTVVFDTGNMKWQLNDGTDVESLKNNPAALSDYNRISEIISDLTGAWTAYADAKKEYETINLVELLSLEESMASVDRNLTINSNADQMLVY